MDDIIAAAPYADQVWVFLNQGNGTFEAKSYSTLGTFTDSNGFTDSAGNCPMDVAVEDLGNGYVDIVTADSGDGISTANSVDSTVSVMLGNGNWHV